MTTPTLRTPRLTLRALRPDDAPALSAGAGDYDAARWLSAVPYPYGLSDAVRFIGQRGPDDRVWAIGDGAGLQDVIATGAGRRPMRALGQDVDSTEMRLTRQTWRTGRDVADMRHAAQ